MTAFDNHRPDSRGRLLKWATYASVSVALLLAALKAAAWVLSGSVSILAGFTDSLTDLAASLFNLFAVRLALRPADDGHAFGHGKAEGLSALAQAAFISGSAVFLLLNALNRLMNPEPLQHTGWGIAVMVVSVVMTSGLVLFQRYVLKQQASQAVEADKLHYVTDLLSNAAILAALVMAAYGLHEADAWLALLVAVWIGKSVFDIGRAAVHTLMDKSLPPQEVEAVCRAVLSLPEVRGVHDVKTRRSGNTVFVQLHIDLDAAMTLADSHRVAVAAAAGVKELFDEADVLVHTDPV